MLFLLIMLITLFLQNNAIFFRLELFKELIVFHNFSYVLKHKQDIYIYIFLAYKTSRAIVRLFFSKFFQSTFSNENFIPSQLYLFKNCLIFNILCGSFFIFYDLTRLLQRIENICYPFY